MQCIDDSDDGGTGGSADAVGGVILTAMMLTVYLLRGSESNIFLK